MSSFNAFYTHLFPHVQNSMSVKDRRSLYKLLRENTQDPSTFVDTLLPKYGVTVGQFSVSQVLNVSHGSSKKCA